MGTVFVLGRDAIGVVAEDRDPGYSGGPLRYYLTECCGASAKGMEDYTGCRSCYAEIDPALGGVPDSKTVMVKGTRDEKPERAICYDDLFGGWWAFADVPLELVEVYGDGIAYDDWKSKVRS